MTEAITTRAATDASGGKLRDWQWERRERIVRAALELLEDGDYKQIQMRDVVERSGFSLGTVYRYFSSKEHLYAAVMTLWVDSFARELGRRPLQGDPAERMKQLVGRVIRAFERKPQFLRLEIVLMNSSDERAVALLREVADRNRASFLEALPGIAPEVAERVVSVVESVLAMDLHQYARGHMPIERVHERALGAVELIFSPGPEGEPRTTAG